MGYVLDDGWDNCTPVARSGNAAFGVYVRCGIWVARNLTDGFIPGEIATAYGSPELTRKLVSAGLWEAVEGGYLAADYLRLNPTAEVVSRRRKADAERKARWREKAAKARKQGNRAAQPGPRGTRRGTHASQDAGQDAGRTVSLSFSSKEEKGDARPASQGAASVPDERPPPKRGALKPEPPVDLGEVRAKLRAASRKAHARERPHGDPLAALDAALAEQNGRIGGTA